MGEEADADWDAGLVEWGMEDARDYYRRQRGGTRVLTGADWSAGRKPTGIAYGYRFVDPTRECRTKEDWPYSYSEHYLWGEREKGCEAVYSDRLAQWDHEKAAAALKGMSGRYGHWGKAGTSKYLSAYFGKPIEAVAVAEGCNVSNGYPYWVFWFRDAPPILPEDSQ